MLNIKDYINAYNDFPQKGILFRDLSPLLASADAMTYSVETFYEKLKPFEPDIIAGIESRGFLFSTLVANRFNIGSIMLRKPGKLPGDIITESYSLEYGQNTLAAQQNEHLKGKNIVILDDLLATGGTIVAAQNIIKKLGAKPVAVAVIIHLKALEGENKLQNMPLISLTSYE